MIDDKTKAAVLREYAEQWAEISLETANCIRDDADALDPQKPEIPDGFVWFRLYKGKWRRGLLCVGEVVNQYAGKFMIHEIEDIRPARILEPGQVAVDRDVLSSAKRMLSWHGAAESAEQLQAALDRDTEARR